MQSFTSNIYVNGITDNAHIVSAMVNENITLFKEYVTESNVNTVVNRQQYTLLHFLVQKKWNKNPMPFYEVLFENGCDINVVDEDDMLPIMVCTVNETTKPLIKRLVRDGSYLETNSSSFIQTQIFQNSLTGVKFALEELDEDINHTSPLQPRTPLELCFYLGNYELAEYLLEKIPAGGAKLIGVFFENLSDNVFKVRKAMPVLQELINNTMEQDLIALNMYHLILDYLRNSHVVTSYTIQFVSNCIQFFMVIELSCETVVDGVRPFDIAMHYNKLVPLFEGKLNNRLEDYGFLAAKHNCELALELLYNSGLKEGQV